MLVNNGYALIFHVGDAKVIKYDGQTGEISKLTNDHVKKIEGSDKLYLTQCLGNVLNRKPSIYMNYSEVNDSDRFYVGTDGIFGTLEEGEVVGQCGENACNSLMMKAREKGSTDNITIITLEVKGGANE